MTKSLVIGGILGLTLGIAVEIIMVVLICVLAFAGNTTVEFPGVFLARAVGSADARGLDFLPNATGLVVLLAVIVVVFAAGAAYVRNRRGRPAA